MSSRMSLLSLVALNSMSLVQSAQAQTDQFSIHFTKIEYRYDAGPGARLPFSLELTLAPDGGTTAVLRTHKATDVTLKRGVIGGASTPSTLTLGLQPRAGGDVDGEGTLDIITGAGPGAGPHVKVFDGQTGQGLATQHLELATVASPDDRVVELRFRPAPGARLSGVPASAFNRPEPDQALIARIPRPALGTGLKVYIDVVYNHPTEATVVLNSASFSSH